MRCIQLKTNKYMTFSTPIKKEIKEQSEQNKQNKKKKKKNLK